MEFPYLQPFPEYVDFVQLERSLKVIILCDRYNKKEPIIEGLEFTVLRNVLNKFNTRNLINFLSQDCFALLFVHYYESNGEKDANRQNDVEPEKLKAELQALYEEAEKYSKLQLAQFGEYKKRNEVCIDEPMEDNYPSLFEI